ncbi:MAG: haloacid dehalogenase-like hydrolase [Polyangiaceae bacterium]
MRPTVLLFDIDGTLVTTGGAGRRAMQRGFASLHGHPEALAFPLDGMTDRLIVRRGLTNVGAEPTKEAIDAVLAAYVDVLQQEIEQVPLERYRVHAGMREAVLGGRERGHAVGLGTGNVLDGARLKLAHVGLFEHFGFGGYGSDAEERAEVIRIGADRGAAALGKPRSECRVVIIGDTPKDVAAAQAIDAECIGVATGSYSVEALLACGATAAFADLHGRRRAHDPLRRVSARRLLAVSPNQRRAARANAEESE